MRTGFLLAGFAAGGIAALGASASAAETGAAASVPPAPETRKSLRIELKVPQIPGATAKPDSKSWPKTLPEAAAEKEAAGKPSATWTAAEIAAAKARCTAVLKRVNAIAIPQDPIKEGICGTPAPVQLISIGKNPEVALSPPAVVNCDFAEALGTWLESDVQPLARKHLGTNIIKIEVMSSYSCRNAYGRAGNRLSEHGLANALDIRGFVSATGKTAFVLEDWGTTQREIAAGIAAEKAKAAKAVAAAQAAEKAAEAAQATGSTQAANGARQAPAPAASSAPEKVPNEPMDEKSRAARALAAADAARRAAEPAHEAANRAGNGYGAVTAATGSTVGAPASGIARSTITDGTPRLTFTLPGAEAEEGDAGDEGSDAGDPGFTVAPNHLGGPKVQVKVQIKTGLPGDAKATANEAERKEAFLHAAHASACKLFGTTLGPEANAAHRNHLHVDMAARRSAVKICD